MSVGNLPDGMLKISRGQEQKKPYKKKLYVALSCSLVRRIITLRERDKTKGSGNMDMQGVFMAQVLILRVLQHLLKID